MYLLLINCVIQCDQSWNKEQVPGCAKFHQLDTMLIDMHYKHLVNLNHYIPGELETDKHRNKMIEEG